MKNRNKRYTIIDLETENHKYLRRTASPFCPNNFIVAVGWKYGYLDKDPKIHSRCSADYIYDPSILALNNLKIADISDVLVGHNIKFDLLYIWRYEWLQKFFNRGGIIWDTQYAEYLLSAQHPKSHMNSLNDISIKYGGTKKIDLVKEMWENGVLTSDISEDVLTAYLVGNDAVDGDIGNTELIFLKQYEKAKSMGCLTMIQERMEGLLSTTMMEYNGVFVDTKEARERLAILKQEHTALQQDLNSFVPELPEGVEFSWSSKHLVSALIFGGAIKYNVHVPLIKEGSVQYNFVTEKWPLYNGIPISQKSSENALQTPQDIYLSGKKKGDLKFGCVKVNTSPKTIKEIRIFDFPGYVNRKEIMEGKSPKGGWEQGSLKDARGVKCMKVGGDALEILARLDVPFTKVLGKYTALDKEIGTYYVRRSPNGELSGMLTCVDPDTHIIHHSLNHTSTVTGRLSGSNPNMQNIPRDSGSQVKKMFSSRFGEDGIMIEIDYSQIEVIALGLLSEDVNLIRDLNSGIDFHCKRVAIKNGISYEDAVHWCKDETAPDHIKWKTERTKCKIFSFQSQYGAGAETISRETGMSVDEVRSLMQQEKEMYPGIDRLITSIQQHIESVARPFNDPMRGYRTFRRGWWKTFTGTHYTWRSYDAPAFLKSKGITDSFSPPEIKNYPIQGFAGEVVQMALGRLFRFFLKVPANNAVLCNTVHDCVWIDCHKYYVDEISTACKIIMEGIHERIAELYNVEVPVTFPVVVEVGKNMYELHNW